MERDLQFEEDARSGNVMALPPPVPPPIPPPEYDKHFLSISVAVQSANGEAGTLSDALRGVQLRSAAVSEKQEVLLSPLSQLELALRSRKQKQMEEVEEKARAVVKEVRSLHRCTLAQQRDVLFRAKALQNELGNEDLERLEWPMGTINMCLDILAQYKNVHNMLVGARQPLKNALGVKMSEPRQLGRLIMTLSTTVPQAIRAIRRLDEKAGAGLHLQCQQRLQAAEGLARDLAIRMLRESAMRFRKLKMGNLSKFGRINLRKRVIEDTTEAIRVYNKHLRARAGPVLIGEVQEGEKMLVSLESAANHNAATPTGSSDSKLMQAIRQGAEELPLKDADLQFTNEAGDSALHVLCARTPASNNMKERKFVKEHVASLVAAGADINLRNVISSATPLHVAIAAKNVAACRALLQFGPRLRPSLAVQTRGKSPLALLCGHAFQLPEADFVKLFSALLELDPTVVDSATPGGQQTHALSIFALRCRAQERGAMESAADDLPTTAAGTTHFNFSPYLFAEDLSDVTFVVGGQRIAAHRIVLAAQSEAFKELLQGARWQESAQRDVVLEGVDAARFKTLLRWMYGEEIVIRPEDEVTAIEVLQIADRFLVPHVIAKVCSRLLALLNVENAFLIFTSLEGMSPATQPLRKRAALFLCDRYHELHEYDEGSGIIVDAVRYLLQQCKK